MTTPNSMVRARQKGVKNNVDDSPNPDESLRWALHDFQDILSPEQKHIFAQSKVPDARAVCILTTEIDRENAKRKSRGVAARISSFLESIQQFSFIVDTFIQSNPKIAALVWGSVKIALLVRSKVV